MLLLFIAGYLIYSKCTLFDIYCSVYCTGFLLQLRTRLSSVKDKCFLIFGRFVCGSDIGVQLPSSVSAEMSCLWVTSACWTKQFLTGNVPYIQIKESSTVEQDEQKASFSCFETIVCVPKGRMGEHSIRCLSVSSL